MAHHPIITGCLLGVAFALCLLCAIGIAVMRDSFQRLHFSSPVTSLAIFLIAIAVWVEDSQWQSRIKAALIALILFLMNAVLSHATARAIRLRRVDHWAPTPDEDIPIVNDRGEPVARAGETEA